MDALLFFSYLNILLAIPTCLALLGVALFLTIQLRFIQFRSFKRFFAIIRASVQVQAPHRQSKAKTISPLYALFTAMSTSLGIGTLIGPSIAIIIGGPGALFWLICYSVCASVTKYAEVVFAIRFRHVEPDGTVIGGPMHYLSAIGPWLGTLYACTTIILFTGWSGLQSNAMAEILSHEGLPEWMSGLGMALLAFTILSGGAQRIGAFSSKLVPIMTGIFLISALSIFQSHSAYILPALSSILKGAFSTYAPTGGFLGASILLAIRTGIYKGAYITESGVGTAAIPHALADVKKPTDQATLAMVSVFIDTFVCFISGLLVLCTDFWYVPQLSNILMYKVFQCTLPVFGKPIIVFILLLFAIGTIIGNSFNGRQSFVTLTGTASIYLYNLIVCFIIFISSISSASLVWEIIEVLLPLVAIPNALGIFYLSIKHRSWLTP